MTDSRQEFNPQLRPLEAFPMVVEGEEVTCLRDPLGLAEQPIFLNGPQGLLVSLMDGTNTLRDIQAAFFRRTAELLPLEAIEGLISQLDEYHFLDSPSFRRYFDTLVAEFARAPSRRARHAGTAYEGAAAALRRQIQGFFSGPDGPETAASPETAPAEVRGLIAPHIDFQRGGPTYARAYKALADRPGADRFIVFGTCHHAIHRRFALTAKDYETPLGPAVTDRDFVRRLAAKLPHDYFEDEFAHRGEHAIEFQAVFLRSILRQDFKIIPILVGSFHDLLAAGKTAAEDLAVAGMVGALTETMAEVPGNYCLIAGADLAHVGRHFGDARGPSETSLREVERADQAFLRHVVRGDAEGVFSFIAAEDDSRRVCGYPSIYMILRCLGNVSGRILDYRQWADLRAGAAVTFAGVALYGRSEDSGR
jgi:MEMO1 family protein